MAVNSRVPTAVLAACLIAVAVVVIMSTDAHASQGVACGGTITTDTTLSKNLNCPGDGLTISTDGVTLDLNGHKMSGSGTGVGIMVSGSDVTVESGSVRGFEQGVRIAYPGNHSTLTGLTANRNGTGLTVFAADDTAVTDSTFSHNTSFGIWARSLRLTVEDSRSSHNGGDGFYAFPFSAGLKLIDTAFNDNGGSGIHFDDSNDLSTVSGNDASRNTGDGIQVYSSTGTYTGNTTNHNGRNGIWLTEGAGLVFAQHELIADNISNGNDGHGILACTQVSSPPDPCAPGMVDGGGNFAKHNGQSPDCVNILCGFSPRKE